MGIKVKCQCDEHVLLEDITPFQGNLKTRTPEQRAELMESIKTEGLLMPFAIWRHDGKQHILDGHARYEALVDLLATMPDILQQQLPCIFINAETEEEARKALLQITSSYGKITKAGYKNFTASIQGYVAPSIKRFIPKVASVKPVVKKEIPDVPKDEKPADSYVEKVDEIVKEEREAGYTIIRVKVPEEKAFALREALKQLTYVEIL
jgi:hypothetical protein